MSSDTQDIRAILWDQFSSVLKLIQDKKRSLKLLSVVLQAIIANDAISIHPRIKMVITRGKFKSKKDLISAIEGNQCRRSACNESKEFIQSDRFDLSQKVEEVNIELWSPVELGFNSDYIYLQEVIERAQTIGLQTILPEDVLLILFENMKDPGRVICFGMKPMNINYHLHVFEIHYNTSDGFVLLLCDVTNGCHVKPNDKIAFVRPKKKKK